MRLLLAALLLSGLAYGQAANDSAESVAAAAKKSREAKAATAKKVYTDDDMPSTNGTVNVVGKDTKAANNSYNPYNDPVRDQKSLDYQWQQRIRMQKDRVSSLEQQLKVAEENAARSAHYYSVNPNPNYARYKSQADSLREQLENARKELTDLQDEAHKAGANKAYD